MGDAPEFEVMEEDEEEESIIQRAINWAREKTEYGLSQTLQQTGMAGQAHDLIRGRNEAIDQISTRLNTKEELDD